MHKTDSLKPAVYAWAIIALAILSFGRSIWLNDVAWDDNCWLLSYYSTDSLDGFLKTGFYELKRVPMGILYYYYYSLHKLTEHAHLVWNIFNLLIQVLSPLVLYRLAVNVFRGRTFAAFLIGVAFILCPIDMTLPYYANINYRLGTFFCILSFYLTERAISDRISWKMLSAAIVSSAFPVYFLLETAITLEPARLLFIIFLLNKRYTGRSSIVYAILKTWTPFVLACIPLVIYKLLSKPYGIYANIYTMDPMFFMNLKMHAKIIRHFLFYDWFIYIKNIGHTGIITIITSLIVFTAASVLYRIPTFRDYVKPAEDRVNYSVKGILFGLALIIPAVMMYEFAGRVPAPGMEGRHGTILQFGYAIAFGSLLYLLYVSLTARAMKRTAALSIILFLGTGVFFNNLNLDLFDLGQQYQQDFWKKFTKRFPVLPRKADFLIDAADGSPFYNADLEAYYELEFPLNMLYARSSDPANFRRYRAYAISEGIRGEWKSPDLKNFSRMSHSGKDTFSPDKLIIIYYRGDNILVNNEILTSYPEAPYKMWLNRPAPEFSDIMPQYPLRQKLKAFYQVNVL